MFPFDVRGAASTLLRLPGSAIQWAQGWAQKPIEDRILRLAYGAMVRAYDSTANVLANAWEDLTSTAFATVADLAEVPLERAAELGGAVANSMRDIFIASISAGYRTLVYTLTTAYNGADYLVQAVRDGLNWAYQRLGSLEWWRDVFRGAIDNLYGFASWAGSQITTIAGQVATLASDLWNTVYPFLLGQINALAQHVGDVFDFLTGQVNYALSLARDAIEAVASLAGQVTHITDWLAVVGDFLNIFEFLAALAQDFAEGARDALNDAIEEMFGGES